LIKNIQRKCPKCKTWNKAEEQCTNCGQLLNPEKLREEEKVEREKQKVLLRKPSELERWFEKVENSENILVRAIYQIVYSIWMVFAAIIGFILYAVTATVG